MWFYVEPGVSTCFFLLVLFFYSSICILSFSIETDYLIIDDDFQSLFAAKKKKVHCNHIPMWDLSYDLHQGWTCGHVSFLCLSTPKKVNCVIKHYRRHNRCECVALACCTPRVWRSVIRFPFHHRYDNNVRIVYKHSIPKRLFIHHHNAQRADTSRICKYFLVCLQNVPDKWEILQNRWRRRNYATIVNGKHVPSALDVLQLTSLFYISSVSHEFSLRSFRSDRILFDILKWLMDGFRVLERVVKAR